MPIKRVQFPDGSIKRVEVPEGATNEQIIAFVQSQQQPKADFSGVSSSAESVSRAPQRTVAQSIGRELGLGGRAMIDGALSLPGIVTDPLARMAGLPSAREGATALSDAIGLPTPETASERVGGDITSALTGGGGIIGTGRALAAKAPGVARGVGEMLSSMPKTQIASIVGGAGAGGATREAGGSQGQQVAASLVGGLSPSFGVAGLQAGTRGAIRGGAAGREQMQQGLADFSSVGANPSIGQAAGNYRAQGLESLLSGAPTSGGVMARAAERQADDIGSGLQRMADDFMPNASAERAGRAIERGSETFANNVRATKKALYWQADQLIPDNTTLPLSRTQATLGELTTPKPGAVNTTGALVNPRLAQIAQSVRDDMAANGGVMPYSAVKELRSRIGEELSDFALAPDRPTAQYKRLYASLSQDLEEAARAQGPAAEAAARRANTYTRAAADRLEQVQRVVDKNGGPEKVFNAVMSGTRDGGTTLRAVMQSLPKEGQRAVTGAVIKRMGLANPGAQDAAGEAFSANTFLTNWNKVSPEAKRALFDRHGPKFVQNMDRIARVADRIKSGSQVFANPAGTANKGLAYTYAGSLGASLLTGQVGAFGVLAAGGASANVMARMMTNPKVVSWMARATEMPVSALPQQVMILKAQARNQDDPELAEFAELLEQPPQQPNAAGNGAGQQ